ncbi:unnamed protein product [Diamesa serratosioi]
MLGAFKDERYMDEKYFFRVQRIFLRCIGFWPSTNYMKNYQIGFAIVNVMVVLVYGVFQLNYCIKSDSLLDILDALTPASTQIVTGVKVLIVVYRRNEIKIMLDYLYEFFVTDNNINSRRINSRLSKIGFIFSVILATFTNLTNFFFCTMPIIKDVRLHFKGMKLLKGLPFKAVFPFDIYYTPMYEIIFAISAWSGFITISGITSMDGLFVGLCLHIAGQFDIIRSRLDTLIEVEIESHESQHKFTKEQNDVLYLKLTEIIEKHNFLIEMCESMSKYLAPNVLIHYLSSALVTCICCLMILLAEGAEKLIFINYIVASTTQVFVYSLGGTILVDSSTKINYAAYNVHWYKCDLRCRRAILMIITRSQRQSGVNVPFFDTSLETFASVIRTAGSYITLFKTFL